jgi:hypothetical protein
MIWSVMLYAMLLALAHYRQLATWLGERELTASRLRRDLAEAGLRAATLRVQPQALVETLERLADDVAHDPVGTERALARLGDQLREALDATAATAVPTDR